MKKYIPNIVTGSIGVACLCLLIFQKPEQAIYKVSPVKEIETRIEGQQQLIKIIEQRTGDEKKIIAAFGLEVDQLRGELLKFKLKKDTIQIIQVQDTLIDRLGSENKHLHKVVKSQDTIIGVQYKTINDQDTLINLGKLDLKKVKRQRNGLLLLNIIQTGIIIFKK